MANTVNLVGSRVSVMHLAYDCLECASTVAVSITDGKNSDGYRRLVQQPRDCPECGTRIEITLVAEAPRSQEAAH